MRTKSGGFSISQKAGEHIEVHETARNLALLLKRVIDIGASVTGLIALAPLLLATAIVIRSVDNGPCLFRQWRVGKDGKLFKIIKFRTLQVALCDASGQTQVSEEDPRLTPLGAVLRRYNIDELPQLWNIIAGEMSLVGPRPHVPDMKIGDLRYDLAVPSYAQRLPMRPGLTGWAQCNGYRGRISDTTAAELRIRHDIEYVRAFSLTLDAKILLKTLVQEYLRPSEAAQASPPTTFCGSAETPPV